MLFPYSCFVSSERYCSAVFSHKKGVNFGSAYGCVVFLPPSSR